MYPFNEDRMYQDICPSIIFEDEYRQGFMLGREDGAGNRRVDCNLISEYGYYGLGYADGIEISKQPINTSKSYYNQ